MTEQFPRQDSLPLGHLRIYPKRYIVIWYTEKATSFEVKLTWVKIQILPLSNKINCESNCPHPLNKENRNIKEVGKGTKQGGKER